MSTQTSPEAIIGKKVVVRSSYWVGDEPVPGTLVGYYAKNGTYLFQTKWYRIGDMTHEVSLSQITIEEWN